MFTWGVEEYGELVEISGGKERMKHYFEKTPREKAQNKSNAEADSTDAQTENGRVYAVGRRGNHAAKGRRRAAYRRSV